ncbi:MAG: TetR family transcriptional regulator [Pseudonocardiales bacterium]|nr:TetR family transcriptional regulator [Pseudonocardiales bacterium]
MDIVSAMAPELMDVGADGAPVSSTAGSPPRSAAVAGRPPVTSRDQLEHVGLRLFTELGFDATTVDRVAEEAGISRRTFFRYFDSKNDLPWGDFDRRLDWFRQRLQTAPAAQGLADAISDAVIEFNSVPAGEERWHRQRMTLLLRVPVLQAHGTLRYREWRRVVAEFVAKRTGADAEDLLPRAAGHLALGAAVAAYEQWLTDEQLELPELLRRSFILFRTGLPD